MQPSQSYPSDLSDARWELIRPTLEAWRRARAGIRKPTHDLRTLMNAILYVDRTGIPWRYLPHDFPPHHTVYGFFARWEADGLFDQLTNILRGKVRKAEGHASHPAAADLLALFADGRPTARHRMRWGMPSLDRGQGCYRLSTASQTLPPSAQVHSHRHSDAVA